MNDRAHAVLDEYTQRIEQEALAIKTLDNETYLSQREGMLLGIGPETGKFLNLLIKVRRPRTIVEVGTAFGYSTLWLAEAAANVGAKATTIEIAPEKQQYAADMLRRAGLEGHVQFIRADALQALAQMRQTVDFVLIDLWKDLYIPAFDLLYPRLAPGAVVCADNMLFPDYQREAARLYIQHLRSIPNAESVTVPIGSGVEFSVFAEAL